MTRPQPGDFAPYHTGYLNLVEADDLHTAIQKYSPVLLEFFNNLPEDKMDYRYAEGKWSVKELLQHVIDAERIFACRVLRIARHDKTPLPSFEENDYAANSEAGRRDRDSLLNEFKAVRISTDLLLQSFSPDQLQQKSVVSNHLLTANTIGYIIFGHLLHHKNILQERYLNTTPAVQV